MAKRLKFDPPSPIVFTSLICVKSEVLRVEEANKQRSKKDKHCL